ncbi:MAG: cyclic nucleotide-binding domain-containing protein [Bacteroidota bacterium]
MSNFKDILLLDSEARIKFYKKGSILHEKGKITQQAFYVNKGLLRSYIIDSKGKEHIFMFATEGWIIADIESQEFDQASELYIDCLEDSEVVVFDRSRLFFRVRRPISLKSTLSCFTGVWESFKEGS